MSDKEKLEKIGEIVDAWMDQPDPLPGVEESPEAADVLCAIQEIVEASS